MIAHIIKILQSDNYYGAGPCTEIAKGKNQYTTNIRKAGEKIKRRIKNRK
tara:strand:+ start:536 stop:685 length:150 start_codon:yes stop_codon:yes gene_type:complete